MAATDPQRIFRILDQLCAKPSAALVVRENQAAVLAPVAQEQARGVRLARQSLLAETELLETVRAAAEVHPAHHREMAQQPRHQLEPQKLERAPEVMERPQQLPALRVHRPAVVAAVVSLLLALDQQAMPAVTAD